MKTYSSILIFMIFMSGLAAQDPGNDTIRLQEVVVTAVRVDQKDVSLMPVQSLSGVDLEYIAGNSVAGVLSTFSGVTIKDYGGIGGLKTVMIRSLGANHTGVFIDGIQFSDIASGQLDMGKISLENASEVSLNVAHSNDLSQAARFYASANVINIKSRFPDFKSKSFFFKSSLKTGSFGLIQPYMSFHKRINDSSHTAVSVSYTSAHGAYPFRISFGSSSDMIEKRENSDIQALNVNSSYNYRFSERGQLSLKLYYHDSERGLPGAVVLYNPYSEQRLWNKDLISGMQYKNELNRRFSIISNIKFAHHRLRYLDPGFLNSQGKIDNSYLQNEYYASQVLQYRVKDFLNVSLAGDFFVNTLTTDTYRISSPIRYSALSVLAFDYRLKRFETSGNLLASYISDRSVAEGIQSRTSKLSPSFALSYKITKNGRIRLNFMFKDIFRMPSFNEQYYNLVGNTELRPENSRQYNIGLSSYSGNDVFSRISLTSNIYYNRVYDKIIAVPTRNLFVWSMQNLGVADIRGFELQADLQTKPFFEYFRYSLNANYTFQKAIDLTKEDSPTYREQIPYIPFETFSSRSVVSYRQFSLGYNILFNGFRYSLGENIFENMLPSWWLSDLSLIYRVDHHKYTFSMKGEISNIFNRQYEVVRSFPMPGRAYYLTLSLNY